MVNIGDEVTVALPVFAEYSIMIEVTEEMIGEDGDVDYDVVMNEAYNQLPSGLCHQCSTGNSGKGWGENSPVNLELGDSPEVHYILDSEGRAVWGDPNRKLGW